MLESYLNGILERTPIFAHAQPKIQCRFKLTGRGSLRRDPALLIHSLQCRFKLTGRGSLRRDPSLDGDEDFGLKKALLAVVILGKKGGSEGPEPERIKKGEIKIGGEETQ